MSVAFVQPIYDVFSGILGRYVRLVVPRSNMASSKVITFRQHDELSTEPSEVSAGQHHKVPWCIPAQCSPELDLTFLFQLCRILQILEHI
jgi:hypothetical protein